jgi:hypothetical protein
MESIDWLGEIWFQVKRNSGNLLFLVFSIMLLMGYAIEKLTKPTIRRIPNLVVVIALIQLSAGSIALLADRPDVYNTVTAICYGSMLFTLFVVEPRRKRRTQEGEKAAGSADEEAETPHSQEPATGPATPNKEQHASKQPESTRSGRSTGGQTGREGPRRRGQTMS